MESSQRSSIGHLSPARLPAGLTPSTEKKMPSSFEQKSGLSSATNTRRFTIHHPLEKKVNETPGADSLKNASKVVNAAFTSPRNLKMKYVSKHGKSRADIAVFNKLPYNKENADPMLSSSKSLGYAAENTSLTQDSSPLKRYAPDALKHPRKITKIVTNANDISELSVGSQLRIEDAFHKEDLVASIQARRSSPERVVNYPSIVDNDSETEYEYGAMGNRVSETILGDMTHTQLSRIIRTDLIKEYITPQRPTESVAKSPANNQQIRINDDIDLANPEDPQNSNLKDVTSPLNFHRPTDAEGSAGSLLHFVSTVEDEPTINFIESLHSNAIFTMEQMNKIQSKFAEDLARLEDSLSAKNTELSQLNFALTSAKNDLLTKEHQVKSLKQFRETSISNSEILKIQIKHDEHSLAICKKSIKSKEELIFQLETELELSRTKLEDSHRRLEAKHMELKTLKQEFEEVKQTLETLKEKTIVGDQEVLQLESALKNKTSNIAQITNLNQQLESDIEKLVAEKEVIANEANEVAERYADLSSQLQEARDLNLRQEELLQELDNLESLGKQKIQRLEMTMEEKTRLLSSANNEVERLQKELSHSKDELSKKSILMQEKSSEFQRRIDDYISDRKLLREEVEHMKSAKTKLENKIEKLIHEANEGSNENKVFVEEMQSRIKDLEIQLSSTEQERNALEKSKNDKDSTINEDTKRMNELVNTIDRQRIKYEAKLVKLRDENALSVKEMNEFESIKTENEVLKRQVQTLDSLLETKIQEVATFLHKEYAEKHMKKLREVKEKYDKELDALSMEKKSLLREIGLFKKKLQRANEECRRVNDFVQLNKLNYSKKQTHLSPRREDRSRYHSNN